MKITLTEAGKRFNRDWIFRHVSYQFSTGHSYAITGPNGSGKSTLLQVIAGAITLSEGSLNHEWNDNNKILTNAPNSNSPVVKGEIRQVPADHIFRHISISAPYLELIEEMTLIEFFHFHRRFKPLISSIDIDTIISLIGLSHSAHKQMRYFSSGMKQRVKLAQAVFSDTAVVLLDEPCTNLDSEGIDTYLKLIATYCQNRLLVIASNDKQEIGFCDNTLDMVKLKNQPAQPMIVDR